MIVWDQLFVVNMYCKQKSPTDQSIFIFIWKIFISFSPPWREGLIALTGAGYVIKAHENYWTIIGVYLFILLAGFKLTVRLVFLIPLPSWV